MTPREPFKPVPASLDLPALEAEILARWDREGTFQKTLAQTASGPLYSFYDGPPFATGLPHYGHLLAGTLKDIFPRYWTMRGYHVPRRFGWDCHGLPVEQEINKSLGVSTRRETLALGVGRYNEACRGIVTRYTDAWRTTVRRMGRWVDMDNAYYTMQPSFMEGVWWVFKSLWDKGLIYEGYKVVPYSLGVSSPLSNFEARQNYKRVQDPALTVAFKLRDREDTHLLAWTTTPWTLPSNLALAVDRRSPYVRALEAATGRRYVLAKARLEHTFPGLKGVSIEEEFQGSELLGMSYEPLFPYFSELADKGSFRVLHGDHVTMDQGTGVVHIAPAFGEEDFLVARAHGLPVVNPVDDDGQFTREVPDYQGRRVKDADGDLIARLKREGKLLRHDTLEHEYPFCYRTDTPLIYRAVSSWFVRVEALRERLVACNRTTRWVPEALRDGRFGNWLEDARDWAISRNRFWGCPLPVWRNPEGEVVCVGSVDELEALSGQRVTDLHTHFVDEVTIPSPTGRSPLKRIEPVLDCWFESGAMPYAQQGYPKTNRERFEQGFPADFIAEGLDQTRGWFYTLMVLGTALFDRAPFKNVVVNGIVLNDKGEKMSKRLRNYPEPEAVLERHGADALRLYLSASPVVRAENLRFDEKGVRETVRKLLLRWWNAYAFFVTYANVAGFEPRGAGAPESPNVLDRWVLSRLHTLLATVQREMEAYRLYNVVPALVTFIEELTNTHIRLVRRHVWEGTPEERAGSLETLYAVLTTLCRAMAPFTPFLTETMHEALLLGRPGAAESVHLEPYPMPEEGRRDLRLEASVARMERALELGRNLREQAKVRTRVPLQALTLVHRDPRALAELRALEPYLKDELNVREVRYEGREETLVEVRCRADFRRLGQRLGKRMKEVAAAVERLTAEDLAALEAGGTLTVAGELLTAEDVEVRRSPRSEGQLLGVDRLVCVALDPTVTPEQRLEGGAREVARRVQVARRNARLDRRDRVRLELALPPELVQALEVHGASVLADCGALSYSVVEEPAGDHAEWSEADGERIGVGLRVER
ncbi:MAG: isoleucine--tRNA ligase [Deltaproteobacteria bacterium]|nr:isoleucine--tRNA ligase [Deltaproteobacteria bacterium]